MNQTQTVQKRGRRARADDLRAELLAGIPVTENRLELAGISTALLAGGTGQPMVLLHGPGGNATYWLRVLPALVEHYHVIAPDLPGQGHSESGEEVDASTILEWLGQLIDRTCEAPPVLVGYAIGGAIAARFAIEHGDRISRLVLVDALGLAPFRPTADFGAALNAFMAQPDETTHDQLWRQCVIDLDAVQSGMGDRWHAFKAYTLDRARIPAVMKGLSRQMADFGLDAIPSDQLARIPVPASLIWGRSSQATPLSIARAASERYDWPLHVIENCGDDPAIEQPAALAHMLQT